MNKVIFLQLCLVLLSSVVIHAELNSSGATFSTLERSNSSFASRAIPNVYVAPVGTFSTVPYATPGASLSSWSMQGTYYYGQVITNLNSLYSYSYYLNSPVTLTDRIYGQVFEIDNNYIVTRLVWSGAFTLGSTGGQTGVDAVSGFRKVTVLLSGGITLNPSINYWLTLKADSTSKAYSWSLASQNGYSGAWWSNAPNVAFGSTRLEGGSGLFTLEVEQAFAVTINSASSVPTSGGLTTITGSFGSVSSVSINGKNCPITAVSSTTIQCQAPAGTGENNAITVVSTQTVTRNIFNYYDVNECLVAGACPAGYTCFNTYGSFACNDTNECLASPSPCNSHATCNNTIGSFSCKCNAGFAGNGFNCSDVDECLSSPCIAQATCTNTIGSYTCQCKPGYSGNGVNCTDVNECLASPCNALATCNNTVGSFVCKCKSGYSGNGFNCSDVDECQSHPCDAVATCTNTVGSFACACPLGFSGDGFSCARCGTTGIKIPVFDNDKTSFSNDTLTLTVNIEGSPSRIATVIHIGGSANPACSFPGLSSASFFQEDCVETFVLSLPWEHHDLCNFVKDDSDSETVTYTASVHVTTTDKVGELRGRPLNRTQTDILKVAVSFPKRVSVSARIVVHAPVALQSQVTKQSFDPVAKTGSASFVTSLQWPFVLQGGSVSQLPNGITLVESLNDISANGDCANSGGVCYQTFSFEVTPDNVTCVLDGDYLVDFQVACRGAEQCPFDGTTFNVQAVVTLQSADFCATLTSSVAVTSKLTSYFDSSKLLEKTSYVVNQTSFFEVAVTSPDSPLSAVTLQSVVVSQQGHTLELIDLDGVISQVSNGVSSSSFSLFFHSNYFVVPTDESLVYDITATVDLSFSHNDRKRNNRRTRALRAITEASSKVQINGPHQQRDDAVKANSANKLAPIVGAIFAILFVFIF